MRHFPTALLAFSAAIAVPCLAQKIDSESLPGVRPIANTLIRNESVEAVVRGMIARSLNGDTRGTRLEIETPAYDQTLPLPSPAPELKQILDVLGVGDHLDLRVNPVKAVFELPSSSLDIGVRKLEGNRFEVTAAWMITGFTAETGRLTVQVPEGVFDRAFTIDSSPIRLGLKPGSRPIELRLRLLLDLTDDGTRISLTGYHINLNGRRPPSFFLTLGRLTLDGEPLQLEIGSNGQSVLATEERIREQFQLETPRILQSLLDRMSVAIREKVALLAKRIEEQPPLRLTLLSDDLIRDSGLGQDIRDFLAGIRTDLMFSHLQYLEREKLFSAQIAARFCFDGSCLLDRSPPDRTSPDGLAWMPPTDTVGVMFYESTFRDLIHSGPVQQRIRKLYLDSGPSPGVALAPAGVKIRFNPAGNAVSAILNLEIDIAKTVSSNSSFGDRISRELGDLIETLFGSGSTVKVPLEIGFRIGEITPAPDGSSLLAIRSTLPFGADGAWIPPANCPKDWCQSNVGSMTSYVRKSLMKSLQEEFRKIVPDRILLPVRRDMEVRDFSFNPKNARITPDHSLLISGVLRDEEGGKR